MGRYPSPKIATRMHFSTLKTALKIEQKCKNTKKLPKFSKRLEILQNPQNFNLRGDF